MRRENTVRYRLSSGLGGLLVTAIAGFSATSMAGTVDLSATPPEASTTVAPNLVLTFDDSGSMNWHHSPDARPYTGAGWNTANDGDQSDTANRTYRSAAGPYLCAGVITPKRDDATVDAADPRSWSMNGVYFNPDNTYDPPLKADGTSSMPDSVYTNAWDNGIDANRPSNPVGKITSGSNQNIRDLSTYSFCGHTGAGYFKYTGNKASLPLSNGQFTAGAKTALYNASNWTWVPLTSAADKANFANWYSYYRTRTMAAVTAISLAYAPFNKNVRVAWQNINSNKLTNNNKIFKFVDDATTSNVRTRFYDWLFAMPASGSTPNRTAVQRVGNYFTNRTGAVDNNPYWDRDVGKELVCRQNFHIQMTDGMWNSDNPTTPGDDTTSITLPDGRKFSTSDAESKVVWNEASNSVATMADFAFYYWSRDLQAGVTSGLFKDAANRLKVSPHITDTSTNLFGKPWATGTDARDNKEIYWNPANDPASWPHLVQYMIGFGAAGNLVNNDTTYLNLRNGTTAWPVPASGTDDGRKIDDMWHAALNSRGEFFAASSPSELVLALKKIINSIVARSTTAVAASLSAPILSPVAETFKAGYDTNDWTGTVTANRVNADGTVSTVALWNARDLLDARAPSSRVILTSTAVGEGNGSAFTGTTVVNAINAVDANFGTATSTPSGTDRLAWLRGDISKQGTSFRQRNHILGAIMNAQGLYVAQPASGYRNVWPALSDEAKAEADGEGYTKFLSDHSKRAPTLYVAANDGMLHAFDATTAADTYPDTVDVSPSPGKERWAYVPYSAYGKLANWSSLNSFSFQPSVDGTPVSRDVYFGSGSAKGWHTILVAGLRFGGRGVYALDITDASASESDPGAKVLWEFNNTSPGGSNLGYTYGRPNIGRLANGQWVVIVPAGYFPTGSTDPAANNSFSSLFVLDAQTGALIKEIKTPTTVSGITGTVVSSGLTTPVLGDYQGDQIDDVAFAGDLQGDIWRFDLTGASTNWKAELFFRSSNPGDRPITVMPRLFADPIGGGMVVVFGTGKYLAAADNVIDSNTKQQAVYGIRDSGAAGQAVVVEGSSATPLVQQTLSEQNSVRGLTTNPVPAKNSSGVVNRGWFFNLYVNDGTSQTDKGERVVVDAAALPDTNRAIITTLIPQDNDPCDPAPRGAVMFVDAATGGAAAGVNFGESTGWSTGTQQAGALVKNPPTGGFLPVASAVGGGTVYLPGLTLLDDKTTPSAGAPIWRRRSWRTLNNDQ